MTLQKLTYVPVVAAMGGYAYQDNVIPLVPRDVSFIGVVATHNLFDFGKREHTIKGAIAQAEMAQRRRSGGNVVSGISWVCWNRMCRTDTDGIRYFGLLAPRSKGQKYVGLFVLLGQKRFPSLLVGLNTTNPTRLWEADIVMESISLTIRQPGSEC